MDARSYFEDKKVTVMGLGLLGRGLGDVRYLAEMGAELIVTDLKTKEQLASSVEALQHFSHITFVLGEHRLEDFQGRDMVLKAAGVPMNSPYIEEAHKNGISVKMSSSLFVELAQIPVVGVTGTRGKSTTTHMIHEILVAAGKKALLGGNVRGVSTLALLPEVIPESIAVLELDSWQLQGFGEAQISPQIAVFTTFFPDHLNYYNDNLDTYLADKANIFLFQKPGDTLVLGAQCAGLIQGKYSGLMQGWTSLVGADDLPSDWKLRVPGEHNRYDAALARRAAQAFEVDDDVIRTALEGFTGVPGRLEFVATVDGVDYYNDTTATTPEATQAALTALGQKYAGRVIAIMGGADKAIDMAELLKAIPENTLRVELLAGTGTDRIRNELPDAEVFDNLIAAVGNARRHAQPGDAILLSPGFASFGMFKNEYDRGDQFNAIVKGFGV
ncbi:MAG: UDP-N-acetylmuramoylalanine--D-glutamate ligase [Parcubacteria group bacterium]|nr:UDP-N-acetylmuramoylalanine--D-glutamate ligase [Parcubacteria group bacterium]